MPNLSWGHPELTITLAWDSATPVHVEAVQSNALRVESTHLVPVVEVLTAAFGHVPATSRLAHTRVGNELRYVSHMSSESGDERRLEVTLRSDVVGVEAVLQLRSRVGIAAVTSSVRITAVGDQRQLLRSVASWSAPFGRPAHAAALEDELAPWSVLRGQAQWLGEGRWSSVPVRDAGLPQLRLDIPGYDARGYIGSRSFGTWSTAGELPVGGVHSAGVAWLWQVEHNGAWRWEIGEEVGGGSVTLSGPTDDDHNWTRSLAPGESFETVPVTVSLGTDLDGAAGELTRNRRARRRPHADNEAMSVVFNDYMNTLNGDPTTRKLLPLIESAAAAGAEIFCIDAGWYDDGGDWWPSVGAWQPSTTRFPGGLGEVIEHIRGQGMMAGLWLEPEVIGVNSPMAQALPDDAFMQRDGIRVEEHLRHHLDLRHPAAIAHLDETVDRLVHDFGIDFFKFDYNINAGPGTDVDAQSPGDGLLQHNRAHLAWIDSLLDRHPGLVIENCASGGMRMDYAMLSRLQMQSTSDQQDFRSYPAIAAAAPMAMLPEQAANWAYPQPGMNHEEIAYCLVTGLLGRFYLSGYLNNMSPAQIALVHEAVHVAKTIRSDIVRSTPAWPLGLPGWRDPAIALALDTPTGSYLSLWKRDATADTIRIPLPSLAGTDIAVATVFPLSLPEWETSWDRGAGILTVVTSSESLAARTLRITALSRPAAG